MNSLARRPLLCVLLCACSGGPISDYPRPVTDGDGQHNGDGDGDGDLAGDGDDSVHGDGDSESGADAGSQVPGNDSGEDGGVDIDAGDGGGILSDDGGEDAGPGALGSLSGDLDVLDTELTSADPALFVNHFDFGTIDLTQLSEEDLARLAPGTRRMLEEGGLFPSIKNLVSYEVLARSEGAVLLKLESQIAYDTIAGEEADYLVQIDGTKIGVTVARAESFPSAAEYTLDAATGLLEARLTEILQANENVADHDEWEKQILHILAYSEAHATALQTAYAALSAQTKGNTIVILTITDGDDAFLY